MRDTLIIMTLLRRSLLFSLHLGGVNDNNAINPINNATNTVNEEIPRLKILLEVEELNQTQEIWTKFRTMLSNSANKLIASEKIPVEQCR